MSEIATAGVVRDCASSFKRLYRTRAEHRAHVYFFLESAPFISHCVVGSPVLASYVAPVGKKPAITIRVMVIAISNA